MARGVFLTGTDTGVGKTVTAVATLRGLQALGVRAVGMKPVSAGNEASSGRNADVDALAAVSGVDAPLAERNPYAFGEPVAPHLAAMRERRRIELAPIATAYAALSRRADAVVVEGAGGALVPLDDRHDMLDIARTLALPVVLIVGMRLGCLHQARAAVLAIRARGLTLAGWVASRVDPAMLLADENVAWLATEIGSAPVADLATATPAPLGAAALRALGLVDGASNRG
jgi:dethiobiotin synthetase